jgi:hypothetical protein
VEHKRAVYKQVFQQSVLKSRAEHKQAEHKQVFQQQAQALVLVLVLVLNCDSDNHKPRYCDSHPHWFFRCVRVRLLLIMPRLSHKKLA